MDIQCKKIWYWKPSSSNDFFTFCMWLKLSKPWLWWAKGGPHPLFLTLSNTSYQVEGKGFGFLKYLFTRIHCTCWLWNQLRICVNSKEKKFLTRLARAPWSQGWLKLWCQLNMQWKYLAIETPKVIQNKFFILCVFVLFFLWIWLKLVKIFMCCRCDRSGQEIKHCALCIASHYLQGGTWRSCFDLHGGTKWGIRGLQKVQGIFVVLFCKICVFFLLSWFNRFVFIL
jgi:hypothetical protein